jgi:protein TonB
MKYTLSLFLALILVGCASTPTKTQPGAVLTGPELPPVNSEGMIGSGPPPKLVHMERPVYPFYLKRQGIVGVVIVGFIIDTDGSVTDIHVVDSPHPGLSKAAVNAVKKFKFEPALRNGIPGRIKMRIPFEFDIKKEK